MKQEELNEKLKSVIRQAREIGIPVPDNISENVVINPRPRKRFGCCRRHKFQIEVSSFVLDCLVIRSLECWPMRFNRNDSKIARTTKPQPWLPPWFPRWFPRCSPRWFPASLPAAPFPPGRNGMWRGRNSSAS